MDWTKSEECRSLFSQNKSPSEPRRRELLVQWVHEVYHQLEKEREEAENKGEKSIFELAFLRTGCLVSANGDSVDEEIDPEGLAKAMADSADPWYKQHGILKFRDLLPCTDGTCNHALPEPTPLPSVGPAQRHANDDKVRSLLSSLQRSTDPRMLLIVKCLTSGMVWAGSSFIEFLSKGTARLVEFLSEQKPAEVEAEEKGPPPPRLLHDLDLYRNSDETQKLGKRFLKGWNVEEEKTKGSVNKYRLSLKADANVKLDVDQVNLSNSSINPSTDIWPNLCLRHKEGKLQVGKLWPERGPAMDVTLHNVLRMGGSDGPVPCYVLRRKAMPTFDDEKRFVVDESTCDGRFRGKLYARSASGLISLHPQWKPGPRIVPIEYFEKQNEEYDAEDSEEETSRESDSQSESDMIDDCLAPEDEFKAVTMNHLRNWEPPVDATAQEQLDAALAVRLTKESEADPHGESMRNRPPVNRVNVASTRSLARRSKFQGSYLE